MSPLYFSLWRISSLPPSHGSGGTRINTPTGSAIKGLGRVATLLHFYLYAAHLPCFQDGGTSASLDEGRQGVRGGFSICWSPPIPDLPYENFKVPQGSEASVGAPSLELSLLSYFAGLDFSLSCMRRQPMRPPSLPFPIYSCLEKFLMISSNEYQ